MNGKAEKFFDAVTHLREDLVEEAQDYVFRKSRTPWRKFASLAACLILVVSLGALAVLPRGCGASGGDSSAPAAGSSVTDNAAPPQGQNSPPSGETSPMDPAEPPEATEDGAYGGSGMICFTAQVVEVREDAVLVEPIEYDSHYQYLVYTDGLEVPELEEGDWVAVTYTGGPALATDPPAILTAQSIEKTDPVG